MVDLAATVFGVEMHTAYAYTHRHTPLKSLHCKFMKWILFCCCCSLLFTIWAWAARPQYSVRLSFTICRWEKWMPFVCVDARHSCLHCEWLPLLHQWHNGMNCAVHTNKQMWTIAKDLIHVPAILLLHHCRRRHRCHFLPPSLSLSVPYHFITFYAQCTHTLLRCWYILNRKWENGKLCECERERERKRNETDGNEFSDCGFLCFSFCRLFVHFIFIFIFCCCCVLCVVCLCCSCGIDWTYSLFERLSTLALSTSMNC